MVKSELESTATQTKAPCAHIDNESIVDQPNDTAPVPSRPAHHKPFHSIRTPRLLIRSALPSDAEAICSLVTSPASNPYDPPSTTATVEKLKERITDWTASSARGESAFLSIVLLPESELGQASLNTARPDPQDLDGIANGRLIGIGGINSFEREPASDGSGRQVLVGDVGTLIDYEYWRKGYGAESTSATIDYAFDSLAVSHIFMGTIVENTPWRSMLNGKFGMKRSESDAVMPGGPSKGKDGYTWKFTKADWIEGRKVVAAPQIQGY